MRVSVIKGAKYMSRKNIILTIVSIISMLTLAVLVSILADIIIEKTDNSAKENYEKVFQQSVIGKRINELCASVEYRPYDKTHIEYLPREYHSERGISPKEEGFFSSGDWLCTHYSVDMEYIDKYIETCTDEYTDKEYEIYEIKDVSSEYAVAYKDTDLDCYMGVINLWYQPESLQDYIEDLNITNSDVEIILGYTEKSKNNDEEKLMWVTFTAEDDYLFNEFFKDRKYIGKIGRGMNSGEEIIVMSVYIYQKALKHKVCLDIGLHGSISTDSWEGSSLFSGSAYTTWELLEYMSENYVGYKEEYIE